jgi:hypothetical protein
LSLLLDSFLPLFLSSERKSLLWYSNSSNLQSQIKEYSNLWCCPQHLPGVFQVLLAPPLMDGLRKCGI